ncbi:MAG TPA: hypothetical protein VIM69_02445 [Opitutaceae bacterium]
MKILQRNLRKRAGSAISALDVLKNSVEFFHVNDASHSRDGLNQSELTFRATPIEILNPRKKMAKTSTAKKTKKPAAKAKAKKPAKRAKK